MSNARPDWLAEDDRRIAGELEKHADLQSGITVDVKLDAVDALAVGQSMRALIRARKLPPGTADIYLRVAGQMIAAVRIATAVPR